MAKAVHHRRARTNTSVVSSQRLVKDRIISTLRFHQYALAFLFLTFGIYFILLFSVVLSMRPDGLYAGHVHVWGDWSLHIAMANIFAYKNPSDWFAYHPYWAGGKFTYAFLTNMISGLLMRMGVSLVTAFAVPSMIYALVLIAGMYAVFYQVLRSQKGAVTATSLFFLSSGPGFLRFIPDLMREPTWQLFLYPLRDYSRLEQYEWLAGNFVSGMLMPQRAFLLGMAIAVWVLAGFLYVVFESDHLAESTKRKILLAAGVAAGILPIAHMHSLIALVVITGCISLVTWRQWRTLAWFVIPAGLVTSVFYFKFISGGIENPHFMQVLIGWTAPPGLGAWINMWVEIWGFMIPVTVLGMIFILAQPSTQLPLTKKTFYLSFFALFLFANMVLLQPVKWDNSKIFLWVYFGWCAVAALVLQWLWHHRQIGKLLAITLFLSLSLTGFMELARLPQVNQHTFQMISADDMQLGEELRTHTDPRAVFLTEPTHNHLVLMWAARSVVMGYPTWAWNFGFITDGRLANIRTMYAGGDAALQLLRQYHISYVAIGPGERDNLHADEAFYSSHFPVAFSNMTTNIYDVRSLYH